MSRGDSAATGAAAVAAADPAAEREAERPETALPETALPEVEALARPVAPFPALRRGAITSLQVNLGYRCNQACGHCHVNAGPSRTEAMDADTLALIAPVLRRHRLGCLDLTGGAPELHPGFRDLVRTARDLAVRVIDRCNLTILSEPDQQDLAAFLAAEGVVVVASLPCYLPENVDRQRGAGVFERSIAGLRQLNELGYGLPGSGLELDLVFNPQGPQLPPDQATLEAAYRRVLAADHGVSFNRLLTLTNMPIQRFAAQLEARGQLEDYRRLLRRSHSPANLAHLMCLSTVSVDWRGCLYDCDFNQQLGLAMEPDPAKPAGPLHLRDLLVDDPQGWPVRVADHCFGCSAGAGSSCGGALTAV